MVVAERDLQHALTDATGSTVETSVSKIFLEPQDEFNRTCREVSLDGPLQDGRHSQLTHQPCRGGTDGSWYLACEPDLSIVFSVPSCGHRVPPGTSEQLTSKYTV